MSETNTNAQVDAIRFYPGGSLVCDGIAYGKKLLVARSKNSVWWPEDGSLDWLLDAPTSSQSSIVIAPDGSSVHWPELSKTLAAEDLMGIAPQRNLLRFPHSWKRKTLRSDATSDELADCWYEPSQLEWIDVRRDGTCAKKQRCKGGSANVATGTFTWTLESPTRFLIHERLFRPHTFNAEVQAALAEACGRPIPDEIDSITTSYEIKLFDGKVMELIKTWDTGLRVFGPMPIWWCKWKRPKDWQIN